MYQQIVTPNPMTTYSPYEPGWCLSYVETAFGTAHAYANAREAWEQATKKHTDVPSGLWCPIYFDHLDISEDHIAILAPDQTVYSTSSSSTPVPVHHSSIGDCIRYYNNRLVYRGWSEDLAGTTLIKGDESMTEVQVIELFRFYIGKKKPQLTQQEIDYWRPYTYEQLRDALLKGDEYKAVLERAKKGTENLVNHCPDDLINAYKPTNPSCPVCPECPKYEEVKVYRKVS
jgi:hypothetical protein